jgi:hypothetical protein
MSSLMERALSPEFIEHLRRRGLKGRKRSAADYRSILKDRHAGLTWAAMGKKLGVSRSMACVLFHQATAMKQAGLLE